MNEIEIQDEALAGVIPEGLQLQKYDEADADAITKSGDWLPRLQIFGASTELVKQGLATMGVFGLVYSANKFEELGKEVPFLSVTFRTKALRIPTGENPISYYDRNSDAFKKVISDASQPNSGCMYGPEFLIWLPNPGVFATFFFGSPTLRRVAPALLQLMEAGTNDAGKKVYKPRPALAKINYIKTNKFSWHGALITPYSTPLSPFPEDFAMRISDEVPKFLNPPESQVEKVDEPVAGGRAR